MSKEFRGTFKGAKCLIYMKFRPTHISYYRSCLPTENLFSAGVVAGTTIPCEQCKTAVYKSNKCQKLDQWELISQMDLQSEDQYDVDTGTANMETVETLTFVDSTRGDIDSIVYNKNLIASADSSTNTALANFLSRPTLIDTRTWATSDVRGFLGSEVSPWYAFLNQATIKNKITNYAYIRGKLCIKTVMNATPFHFGKARVFYEPNTSATINSTNAKVRVMSTGGPEGPQVSFSQLPGFWLTPAENAGGELHIPFFRPTNWLKISGTGSANECIGAGRIRYAIYSPLGVASATASASLTIQTYAWMEDVEFMGSTNELVLQAQDEYDGVVSKPASAIANIASKLESIPVIGKFARATTIGANAIASVASIFGFTNVPNIDAPGPIVPLAAPHLATSEISGPYQKLAYDPKQELSIDPTMHGIDSKDELCIKSLITRSSFLALADWATTDAVGTIQFNCRVNPALHYRNDVSDSVPTVRAYRVYHTPLSYIGQMFANWRGDIVFEIEVLCTKFHKGRLLIQWDPIGSAGNAVRPVNTVYSTILDIGESNKVVFTVPYHGKLGFLNTQTNVATDSWNFGSSALATTDVVHNGSLNISVLTPLMSPVTPQTLGIMVSVRAADNFEFANPRTNYSSTIYSPPPSFFDVQSEDRLDPDGSMVQLGDSGTKHPERYGMHFGERIVSLRNILHRVSLAETVPLPTSGATASVCFIKSLSRNLTSYGFDPQGSSSATKWLSAGNTNFNWDVTHPTSYIANMFGGFRGSLNVIINPSADLTPYIGDVRIERMGDDGMNSLHVGTNNWAYNFGDSNAQKLYKSNTAIPWTLAAGGAMTNTQTNSCVQVNWPYMSGYNFQYPSAYHAGPGFSTDGSNLDGLAYQIQLKQNASTLVTERATVTTFVGTGPDFTCLWFLCCPTIDYYVAAPTAP